MSEAPLNMAAQVGGVLRLYRERLGRGLGHVAAPAGISVSMLSQIERGRVSPSIETLLRVCASLGIDASDVFRQAGPRQQVRIARPGGRLRTSLQGATYEQLVASHDPRFPVETFLLELAPSSTVGLSANGHEGIETGYVLTGSAVLTVGTEEKILSAGDSVWFCSSHSHRLTNHRISTFRAVWSVSPPHVDYFTPVENNRLPFAGDSDE